MSTVQTEENDRLDLIALREFGAPTDENIMPLIRLNPAYARLIGYPGGLTIRTQYDGPLPIYEIWDSRRMEDEVAITRERFYLLAKDTFQEGAGIGLHKNDLQETITVSADGPAPPTPTETTTLTVGKASVATGAVNVSGHHEITVGRPTSISMPAIAEGEFYIWTLPNGFTLAEVINPALGFSLLSSGAISRGVGHQSQRWSMGPLNATGAVAFRTTVGEDV